MIPRRYSGSTSKHRDLSNRVYASYEDRMEAMAKAEKLESDLGADFPTLVKTMLQSHVTGGFWLVTKLLYLFIECLFCIYYCQWDCLPKLRLHVIR